MGLFSKKKRTPLISVIIPVYNVEDYLRECLDGVVGQSYSNLEILCIDDGSTDSSPAILAEYAERDKRIKVIRKENGGVANARNTGLDNVSGAYISFLDADDIYETTLYEKVLRQAMKTKADICVFQSDRFIDDFSIRLYNAFAFAEHLFPEKEVFSLSDIPRHAFSVFNGYVWDKLFKADFVNGRRIRFHPIKASSDARFVHFALAVSGRISVVKEILAHHRKDRVGALTQKKDYQSFYSSYTGLRDDLKAEGIWERFEQSWQNRVLHTSLWYLIASDGSINREFFQLLKDSWLEGLGLLGKEESYYMKPEYPECMEHIKNDTYEEFIKTDWYELLYGAR